MAGAPPSLEAPRRTAGRRAALAACLLASAGGVLVAVAGLFRFSLPLIFAGFGLYVAGGYLWEQVRGR